MKIEFVARENIDDKRWNGCVHFAMNAMPYAYTWYLDNVCETWDGLILGEYKAVMPLVHNKKWGQEYIFQPFFVQQLGIFTVMPLSKDLTKTFFEAIPARYKYIEMGIHENSHAPEGFEVQKRINHLLPLKESYELLRKKYSGNLLRNLKKAMKHNLSCTDSMTPEVFVDFYVENTAPKIDGFTEKHKFSMLRFIHKAIYLNVGGLCSVKNENGKMIAANFLLFHPQRTINLLPTSSAEGREKSAMHFLLDIVVQKGAGKMQYLDFEGSMIAGISKFYKSFGAEEVNYLHIKKNNLPWYLQLFKK